MNFADIKQRLNTHEVLTILADCVFDNSETGMAKLADKYGSDDSAHMFGIIQDGETLGVVGFRVLENVEIMHIAVGAKHRNRGIGRSMICELQVRYMLPIEAETDDDAVGFYRKCGFETAEIRKHDIRRWACVLHAIGLAEQEDKCDIAEENI